MKNIVELALESNSGLGDLPREIEYTFFAKMTNLKAIQTAAIAVEKQEQWEYEITKTPDNSKQGKIRIRRSSVKRQKTASSHLYDHLVTERSVTYEQVFKSADSRENVEGGPPSVIEVTTPSTDEAFELFKHFATFGVIKDRYLIPTGMGSLVWEVDCFVSADGSYFDWVKIDLEVKSALKELPAFPSGVDEVIMNQKGSRTPEEILKIKTLWKTGMERKNIHI
jgi:hypothetical protein